MLAVSMVKLRCSHIMCSHLRAVKFDFSVVSLPSEPNNWLSEWYGAQQKGRSQWEVANFSCEKVINLAYIWMGIDILGKQLFKCAVIGSLDAVNLNDLGLADGCLWRTNYGVCWCIKVWWMWEKSDCYRPENLGHKSRGAHIPAHSLGFRWVN